MIITDEMKLGETTQFGQTFYRALADELRPEGCTCINRGGDCDYCSLYYFGMEAIEEVE
jgi:aspartate/glutamate racemase